MRIVVIGGSGLIGSKLVQKLRSRNHDVLAGSSRSGVNAVTGEGLSEAMSGADVVVDVMNSPSWEDSAVLQFFETTTRNLVAAESAAGVKHHVALSVVGTERLQGSGYFRAKLAQERLIHASGIPYTIVRATQFFEFLGGIAEAGADGNSVRLPPALMQPMSAEDVAALLVDDTLGPPINGIVDIAGPETMGIDDAVRRYLVSRGDPRSVSTDAAAKYYGLQVGERSLIPSGDARIAPTKLAEWLSSPNQFAKLA
jgi:uncharacterized protein YbjT (DUF2867 family)